ncbi:hypothetical protein KR038_011049 [Drosophila bunnanda]|nr:hypothetical protein KR038_011049 [Drosophila bunnanda]
MLALNRLRRELTKITQNPPEGCEVRTTDNLFQWLALIKGPDNTPYQGGIFRILFAFPITYPFSPPYVKFVNKIFHPNVSTDGEVCELDDIWTPVQTVECILKSLIMLLLIPIPEEPMNPTAANMYMNNREQYDHNARMWTSQFANEDDSN